MPGLKAYRETPGKAIDARSAGIEVAGIKDEKPVGEGDAGVALELQLPIGEIHLNGYFVRSDGSKIGSYYADVEKL